MKAIFARRALAILMVTPSIAMAEQSLTQAITNQLRTVTETCENLLGDDSPAVLTGGLQEICARNSPAGSEASTQGPSAGNTHSLASEAQALLKNARGDTGKTQVLDSRWSLFANAEQESLDGDATNLADAFDSSATRVNAGVSYALNSDAQFGLAVVSKQQEGDYQQGGDFDSSSLGVRFIADLGLGDDAFVQLLIGQDKTETDRNRVASFTDRANNTVIFFRSASVNSNFEYYETEAAVVFGTYYAVGNATLSPVLGLTWQNIDYGTYSEAGNSGFEVVTYDDSSKSLQALLGVQASWAVPFGWGVWAPQIGATLKNEFENKARKVDVSFTGDTRAKRFSYDIEEGDSNYLAVSAGSVFVLKNGWQFYVNAETYTAYENYSRSLVSTGLRVEL